MTVPHLMNCPHADSGWCAECVAELGNENWRQRDQISALLPGPYYMDPPDSGSVTVLEQLQRMAKDAERYRKLRRSPLVDVRIIGTGMRSGERLDSAVDALPVFVLHNEKVRR